MADDDEVVVETEEALIRARGTAKGTLTRFETFLNGFTETKRSQLASRVAKCEECWKEFFYFQNRIEELGNQTDNEKQRQEFEDHYFKVMGMVESLKLVANTNQNLGSVPQNNAQQMDKNVRLPIMQIPTFQGSYQNWLEFYDTFRALIHTNTQLTGVQKFYYLKNALKGDAAQVINLLEVSEQNYIAAWDLLKERYENKKLIAISHLDSINNFPTIQKESAGQLRKLVDTVRKDLRALETLGHDVKNWDVLLIYILESKVDTATKREWQKECPKNNFASVKDFLTFLEGRCQFLESFMKVTDNKGVNVMNDRPRAATKGSFVASVLGCPICKENHIIFNCKKFLNMSAMGKRNEVKHLRLCWNCLKSGHMVENCRAGGCKHCGRRHHTILHIGESGSYGVDREDSQGRDNHMGDAKRGNSENKNIKTVSRGQYYGTADMQGNAGLQGVSDGHGGQGQGRTDSNFYGQAVAGFQRQGTEGNQKLGYYPMGSRGHLQPESDTQQNYKAVIKAKGEGKQNRTSNEVLLSTAKIFIRDQQGDFIECRALLDSGSMSNFMRRGLWEQTQLSLNRVDISVVGISQSTVNIIDSVRTKIHSRYNNFEVETTFLIVETISENLPSYDLCIENLKIPSNIELADESFDRAGPVDVLLGATVFWDLLSIGHIKLDRGGPFLQKTKLGWVIAGQIPGAKQKNRKVECHFMQEGIENKLERFWALNEEIGEKLHLTVEEKRCEEIFAQTTTRDNKGKFIVRLPAKTGEPVFGNSIASAATRFRQLEKRFDKDKDFKKRYCDVMSEYRDLGHMTRVREFSSLEVLDGLTAGEFADWYFLKHHGVIKETSLTTKLRVVFDASSLTDNGSSLNNTLLVGPKLQEDLFNILVRFRQHQIVITGDIEKMYRQVWVAEDQRKWQSILWRESPGEPVGIYQLNTITYGTGPASFVAVRCLHQLSQDYSNIFPESSQLILRDFYMDDLLTGGDTMEEVVKIREEVSYILQKGGFTLRKWMSSSKEILKNLGHEAGIEHYISDEEDAKVLGLYWNSDRDLFHFRAELKETQGNKVTKRSILGLVAQIFDPLGIVSPIVIRAKLIVQALWRLNLKWDEGIPAELHYSWLRLKDKLNMLENITIPRKIICQGAMEVQLHCFSDASELAFGAVIYVRSTNELGSHFSQLVCSRSRVAPLKTVSLPRLELCAALLGAKLTGSVLKSLTVRVNRVILWTDSTIALSWIKGEPRQWKTFVANRVAEIQGLTEAYVWKHIPTHLNPADLVSRGVEPEKLVNNDFWWQGPSFLLNNEEGWPISKFSVEVEDVPEGKEIKQTFSVRLGENILNRFSSFVRLQRVTAWIYRFYHNCKSSRVDRSQGDLVVSELKFSHDRLISLAQQQSFPEDFASLKESGRVSKSSKLITLNPFLEVATGLIRVGGRLDQAQLDYDQAHPIILDKDHNVTKLIIIREHYKNLHAGTQTLQSLIRLKYWPLTGRNIIRKVIHKCIVCYRVKPSAYKYIMGNLPAVRITPGRPFVRCGVDYAGPFLLKTSKLRRASAVKAYLCVFICLCTKALHLELVSSLSTEAFLNAIKRFISRIGLPSDIFSDNGTNFRGASNHLKELFDYILDSRIKSVYYEHLSQLNIRWHFMPAYSPHFGGIWEAAVKSCKYYLKRVMDNITLDYEEMNTVLAQIEACLNSRPLTPMSEDCNDLLALTPGHFLIGRPLAALPDEDVRFISFGRIRRYHQLTQMVQHFWARWSREYLSQLQKRTKWSSPTANIQEGQMVVLVDKDLPPLKWSLGRVIKVRPGPDDVVRVVEVKTSSGVATRAAAKVCVLPIEKVEALITQNLPAKSSE